LPHRPWPFDPAPPPRAAAPGAAMKTLSKLVVLILALAAVRAEARTFDEIKKSGKIVVATEGAYPPFNFFEGKKLTGFEVDLAEAIVKKMGLEIEWKSLSFDALLAGLAQDRWDMVIASFGITPEREKAVTFTAPHYCSGGIIVAKDPAIKTVKDLEGKLVAVQTGTTYLQNVRKLKGLKAVKNFPKDTDARSALVAGRVDAWVTDRFVAKEAIDSAPADGLHTGDFVFVEKIATAVKKGNTSLVKAYDEALAQLMSDGTYEAISKKYVGEDVRCK
jgi:polar amino acid transport system substrate-binding protein